MNEMNINTEKGIMNIRVCDVSPDFAKELLKLNTFNRSPKKNKINMYASELLSDQWFSNGVPIIIGSDNVLKDGQHRLMACIKANKTLKNMIIVRLPKENCSCYDIGATRTAADTAVLMGITDPIIKSGLALSILRCAIQLENSGAKSSPSKVTLVKEAENNIAALSWVLNKAKKTNKLKGINVAPVWASVMNAFASGYPIDKLELFCDILRSGMATNEKDFPIIQLRNWLLSHTNVTGRGGEKLKFLKAQNALVSYERGLKRMRATDSLIYHYPNSEYRDDYEQSSLDFKFIED